MNIHHHYQCVNAMLHVVNVYTSLQEVNPMVAASAILCKHGHILSLHINDSGIASDAWKIVRAKKQFHPEQNVLIKDT